jgi:YD repeat-containing protein
MERCLLADANGNMTSDGSNTYTWDSRQRLSTLTGTVSGSFSYDAANRQSQKTIAGQTTGYVFDGINLVQELTGTVTSTVQANLLTGGLDEVFSRTEASSSTFSSLVDALGSTLALTDSTGAVTTQYTYDPYGQTSNSGSASTNSQQYTGRENDGIFDSFTNEIEQNRADSALTLGSLLTTEAIGTMPNTSSEMRAFGTPKGEINPLTSQLSRWSGRFKTALRIIGRTPTIIAASTVATTSVVAEGIYDWVVIGKAAWDATSSGDCDCGK